MSKNLVILRYLKKKKVFVLYPYSSCMVFVLHLGDGNKKMFIIFTFCLFFFLDLFCFFFLEKKKILCS